MAINPKIKQKAEDIRSKIFGSEVRESLASGIEAISEDVEATIGRQGYVEEQFQDVLDETTGKDVISAPELIAARNGKSNLKTRLDDEHAQVTAQLQQIAINIKSVGAQGNANYFNPDTKKYYQDAEMSIPATNDRGVFQSLVNTLHAQGGGVIYAPKGNYLFRDAGVDWKSGVHLIGAGVPNTKFVVEGNLFDTFRQKAYDTKGQDGHLEEAWLTDVHFEGFEVDNIGLANKSANISGKAFFILYMRRALFRNLLLKNTIGTALGSDFLTETTIENVIIYKAGRNWGTPNTEGTLIQMGQSGIGVGTAALESETLVIQNCRAYDCGNYGIFVETQYGTTATKHAKIISNHTEGNRIGIGNKGSGATIIEGNTMYRNLEYGLHEHEYVGNGDTIATNYIEENGLDGIYIDHEHDGELLIIGNTIKNNGGRGIYLSGDNKFNKFTKDVIINNNRIFGNARPAIEFGQTKASTKHLNTDIKGNTIYNNSKSGGGIALLIRSAKNINILNNTFYDDQATQTQTIPLHIAEDVEDYYIDGNKFDRDIKTRIYTTNGRIGENKGLSRMAQGVVTFAVGSDTANIDHFLYRHMNTEVSATAPIITVTKIISTSTHIGTNIWLATNPDSSNRATIKRDNTAGELMVHWIAMMSY